MVFSIRQVAASDFDGWLPLWDGYNAFYERVGPTALPQATTDVTWSRFLDPAEPMHALIAQSDDGAILGLTHYLFHRASTTVELSCYLSDLFTTEAARGQGVGRALIQGVYAAAKAAGSTRVYWLTHETNATAMRLYDQVATKSGFQVYRKMV